MSLSVPKVSNFSEEFGIVEQNLRLQLDAPSLKINEMYDISLKPINVQFDTYAKNVSITNIVDVFMPLAAFKQSKNDIIAHGIKIHPKDGFTFKADGVDLEKGQNAFELIHFKANLGHVYNHQDLKSDVETVKYLQSAPTVNNLPEGYNSLRISEDNKFVVFTSAQIKACHLVRFIWDEAKSREVPCYEICDQCGAHGASVWCNNCNKRLCEKCDNEIHSSSKFLAEHPRVSLKEAILETQKCPEHPQANVLYYCNKCNLPVCLECKVKGSHAHGECAKHRLVPIAKAYNDRMLELKRPDPIHVAREKALSEELKNADARLQEIKANQKAVEEEIMRIAYKAIEESRLLSAKSAAAVKSARCELLRKEEEFERQKEILEEYRVHAEPVPLLQTAFRNVCLNREIDGNRDLPGELRAHGDLIVYGRLEVSPPKNPKYAAASEKPAMERGLPAEDASYSYSYTYTASTEATGASNDTANLEPKDPHFTRLEKMAARKAAKYEAAGLKLQFVPFDGSDILSDRDVAERLYMCFPFKAQPETHLLFSSVKHGRNIRTMHKMIDSMGITAVVVKSGSQVFGGFAASKWNSDGVPKREKCSTFLFQINKDAFIPYGGQSDDPCYMFATPDTLTFGREDLVLAGNFDSCSSAIENSFGLGFLYDSKKAKEFLAGSNKFKADIVEVWGFFTSE